MANYTIHYVSEIIINEIIFFRSNYEDIHDSLIHLIIFLNV